MTGRAAEGAPGALIGPNAVTRLAEALGEMEGEGVRAAVFGVAGQGARLMQPPAAMVPEEDVARLHQALHDALGPWRAAEVSWRAGELTAAYLLAHRIPRLAQRILRLLPARLAARIMAGAIARHAWTFAGSGRFSWRLERGLVLTIKGGPVARLLTTQEPACHYYAATFEGVFAAVVGEAVTVRETACEASGGDACVFALSW